MPRPGPIERIRARLAARAGPEMARRLPVHYQRMGRVVLVRWPEELRPEFATLAKELAEAVRSESVARVSGPVAGDRRLPTIERLFGDSLETEVLEDGLRYRFDAGRVLYSRGNNSERARIARLVRPGERVIDLFAGIGYFALPAALHGRALEVIAVEENPVSFGYLQANVALNHLEGIVRPRLGDNRSVELPVASADRVLLGYLPDSLPWIEPSIPLLRRTGGWMHVHLLMGARDAPGLASDRIRAIVHGAGASVRSISERRVKGFGPGKVHLVVDAAIETVDAKAP
jgi:tRNA wybutosine-synthesizing protein 2